MTKEELEQCGCWFSDTGECIKDDISLNKFAKLVAEKAVEEANHIIFKSCINQPHWKRSAMRYLKRNAPMLHHQAVTEFNEHPDGRGQE